ncbi:MAG: ribosomal protein S18-alanine N-acetyltransferase [Chloroflexi bacterium]|nr:ribosomal protein S18-alanine N-acetyltransferase [Chloroflexota bacterium]
MIRVRPMVSADIPQVIAIEQDAFPEDDPPTDFQRELDHPIAHYLVLEDDAQPEADRLLGYTGIWVVLDEAHLMSIGVRTLLRGRGLGELLLIATLDLAIEEGARQMFLEVRVSNVAAQTLYRKYGFVKVGIRRRYYPDNNEDALLMHVNGLTDEDSMRHRQELKRAHAERRSPYEVALY